MAYIFGSIWDRFNRNALNNLSKSVEQQGKSIQNLVADGQLTPEQYAELINVVQGHISKGNVTLDDLSGDVISEITKNSPELNFLTIPRDKSVTNNKINIPRNGLAKTFEWELGSFIGGEGVDYDSVNSLRTDLLFLESGTIINNEDIRTEYLIYEYTADGVIIDNTIKFFATPTKIMRSGWYRITQRFTNRRTLTEAHIETLKNNVYAIDNTSFATMEDAKEIASNQVITNIFKDPHFISQDWINFEYGFQEDFLKFGKSGNRHFLKAETSNDTRGTPYTFNRWGFITDDMRGLEPNDTLKLKLDVKRLWGDGRKAIAVNYYDSNGSLILAKVSDIEYEGDNVFESVVPANSSYWRLTLDGYPHESGMSGFELWSLYLIVDDGNEKPLTDIYTVKNLIKEFGDNYEADINISEIEKLIEDLDGVLPGFQTLTNKVNIVENIVNNLEGYDTPKTLKILAIGNSFTNNSTDYLYNIAQSAGVELVFAKLTTGGATLERHIEKIQENSTYTYTKFGVGGKEDNITLEQAIKDDDWDILTYQQASRYSGDYSAWTPYLSDLISFAKTHSTNPFMKIGLHMTWAYSSDSTQDWFVSDYGGNRDTMRSAIVDAHLKAYAAHDIDILIPAGTALENARTTPQLDAIDDQLTSDGYHLSAGISRYITSLAWFEMLISGKYNKDVFADVSYIPNHTTVNGLNIHLAKVAAINAVNNPFKVTELI